MVEELVSTTTADSEHGGIVVVVDVAVVVVVVAISSVVVDTTCSVDVGNTSGLSEHDAAITEAATTKGTERITGKQYTRSLTSKH